MVRTLSSSLRVGDNSSRGAVCVAIIGLLTLASLVATHIALGKMNQKNGEKGLSQL